MSLTETPTPCFSCCSRSPDPGCCRWFWAPFELLGAGCWSLSRSCGSVMCKCKDHARMFSIIFWPSKKVRQTPIMQAVRYVAIVPAG